MITWLRQGIHTDFDNSDISQVEGIKAFPKKIVRGIPVFDESSYFYPHLSHETMLSLPNLASTIGWKMAILEGVESRVAKYVTSPKRAFFLSILEINKADRILDAGAGCGTISAQMAKGFPSTKVYAFDKSIEMLLFADQIKKQEHLDNMHIMQGDITNPPFENNFFDVVIMIGLLEWLWGSVKTTPKAAQVLALKRIHDILRPGGRLLIGVENRLGYRNFLGAPDYYTGLRFTNLAPHRFGSFSTKPKNNGSYRPCTYSLRGYKRLLQEAGFKDVTFYAALPDYRFPNFICDMDSVKEVAPYRFAKVLPRSLLATLANSFYIKVKR
ncbi:MAG: class I SAM-dependent methyltransferase [Candidatus Bathyarchaeia archaeon]|jgi:SAM-dependent methyltransferase